MNSKELSQTGRQLLSKGKKSFIRAVFNRKTLLFVSLLLQAGILVRRQYSIVLRRQRAVYRCGHADSGEQLHGCQRKNHMAPRD